jgi:purine-binding chemotaxis protein CheW
MSENTTLDFQNAHKQAVLQARARALAVEKVRSKSDEGLEVVEFRMGEESYAFASTYIREVYPVKEITPLPCTPAFVLGIINLRGQILSVLDLRQLFGLPLTDNGPRDRMLIIGSHEMELGIMVDEVVGVRTVPLADFRALPAALEGNRSDYIAGVTTARLILLDAGRILADDSILVHEEVA